MKFILKENQKPLFRLYIDFLLTNFTVYDYDVLSSDLPLIFEDLKEKKILLQNLFGRILAS